MLYEKDPKLIIGYQMWARKVVDFMQKNPQWTPTIYFLIKPWTEWMANEMGVNVSKKRIWIGGLLHKVLSIYSRYVYNNFGGDRYYQLAKLGKTNGN